MLTRRSWKQQQGTRWNEDRFLSKSINKLNDLGVTINPRTWRGLRRSLSEAGTGRQVVVRLLETQYDVFPFRWYVDADPCKHHEAV